MMAMANDGVNATGVQISTDLDISSGNIHIDAGQLNINQGSFNFNASSSGGVSINNGSVFVNNGNVNVNGGVNVSGDVSAHNVSSNNINQTSDRNLKEKFAAINPTEILNRVVALPITSWNFKQDAGERHIGPMAQDFYAAFNVGPDDKHIAVVDEGGVALAAIQGLNQKLEADQAKLQEKDTEIKALEKRMAELEALVKTSARP